MGMMMNLRRSQMTPEKKGKQIIHIVNYMGIGKLPIVSVNEAHTQRVPVTSNLLVNFRYTTSTGQINNNGQAFFAVGSTEAEIRSPVLSLNRKLDAFQLSLYEDEHSIYVLINES